MAEIDLSVVVGFKDWGRQRVAMAVTSIIEAFGDVSGEVIVSDYGSAKEGQEEFEALITSLGGRYVYTDTDGTWSRSRALNAGFAHARGSVLISTDADMIFSPGSLGIVARQILNDDSQAIVLQCRDLPEGFSDEELIGTEVNWHELEHSSRLRPRWGMGGMMACSRAAFLHIRGLDERMEIYGGEDIDFANRLRRSGRRIEWMEDPRVRMYHMWHPPTRRIAAGTPRGAQAIQANTKIHVSDPSYIRNATKWRHAPARAEVPVTVAISTFNRCEYLPDAINSVLAQSMPDFELIVVDDGSTDDTRAVVEAFDDERIRYLYKENAGLAAARNFAADHSRGRFTAIHDDDDIMLPWRLERHLETLTGGASGSYGGWIDFDNENGDINPLYGKRLNLGALLFAGKVYLHPTLMVDTNLLRRVRYDESLRSGSDYNLGIRLLRSGAEFLHTGEFHTLRRLHPGQITETDSSVQKTSAVLSSFMGRVPMSTGNMDKLRAAQKEAKSPSVRGSDDVLGLASGYFPDHLVRRSATATIDSRDSRVDHKRSWLFENATRYLRVETPEGEVETESAYWADVSLATLAALRTHDIAFELQIQGVGPVDTVTTQPSRQDGMGSMLRTLAAKVHQDVEPRLNQPHLFLVSASGPLDIDELVGKGDLRAVSRVVTDGTNNHHLYVLMGGGLKSLGRLHSRLASLPNLAHCGINVPTAHAEQDEAVAMLARSVRDS